MKQQWSLRRKLYNGGMRGLVWLCAGLTCALLIFLIGYIFYRGVPGLSWQLISGQTSYIRNTVGILPNLLNTLYIILVAMVVVLPLGVGAAIYLTEYAASGRLVRIIEFAAETLTGIPSIIFGLVGMMLFVQKLGLQAGILAGSLTLVMMILPTIIRTTQESLKTVPQSYREGALALGAGKWHMVRTVVLPGAVDGIVTGCILAIGRIVGESAALLYTAGFGMALVSLFDSLHTSSATLTVALYVYATEGGETALAFSIATILMVLTLLINLTAGIDRAEAEKEVNDNGPHSASEGSGPVVRRSSGAAQRLHGHPGEEHHRLYRSLRLRQVHISENPEPHERPGAGGEDHRRGPLSGGISMRRGRTCAACAVRSAWCSKTQPLPHEHL